MTRVVYVYLFFSLFFFPKKKGGRGKKEIYVYYSTFFAFQSKKLKVFAMNHCAGVLRTFIRYF